jgi:hypothetical protein
LKHVGALGSGLAYLSWYNSGWFCHTDEAAIAAAHAALPRPHQRTRAPTRSCRSPPYGQEIFDEEEETEEEDSDEDEDTSDDRAKDDDEE